MTPIGFAVLALALECLPPQFDQKWDKAVRQFYMTMLEEIPDADVPMVARAIGRTCKKRPIPADILDVWREVTKSAPMTADAAVSAIYEAMRAPQFVTGSVSVPVFVPQPYSAYERHREAHNRAVVNRWRRGDKRPAKRAPKGTWTTRIDPAQVRVYGMPPSVKNDPILSRIVESMGGWESISTGPGESTPQSVFRGQLRRIAEMVIDNQPTDVIASLRADYQQMRQSQLSYGGALLLECE